MTTTTKTSNQNAQDLADYGIGCAFRAAYEYMRVHGLTAEINTLTKHVLICVRIRIAEATKDAKAAMDCGMVQAAIATFGASMALAGIEAAKEAGIPASFCDKAS